MLYILITSAMLSIFIFLLCLPSGVLPFTLFNKLQLPSSITGPESLAFDLKGEGPYTGVSDGRVLKYQGPAVGFTDFAVTSPNRYPFIRERASSACCLQLHHMRSCACFPVEDRSQILIVSSKYKKFSSCVHYKMNYIPHEP